MANQLLCLSVTSFYNITTQHADYVHNVIFTILIQFRKTKASSKEVLDVGRHVNKILMTRVDRLSGLYDCRVLHINIWVPHQLHIASIRVPVEERTIMTPFFLRKNVSMYRVIVLNAMSCIFLFNKRKIHISITSRQVLKSWVFNMKQVIWRILFLKHAKVKMDIHKSKAPFVIAFHALMIIILTITFMTIFNHCASSQVKQKEFFYFLTKYSTGLLSM